MNQELTKGQFYEIQRVFPGDMRHCPGAKCPASCCRPKLIPEIGGNTPFNTVLLPGELPLLEEQNRLEREELDVEIVRVRERLSILVKNCLGETGCRLNRAKPVVCIAHPFQLDIKASFGTTSTFLESCPPEIFDRLLFDEKIVERILQIRRILGYKDNALWRAIFDLERTGEPAFYHLIRHPEIFRDENFPAATSQNPTELETPEQQSPNALMRALLGDEADREKYLESMSAVGPDIISLIKRLFGVLESRFNSNSPKNGAYRKILETGQRIPLEERMADEELRFQLVCIQDAAQVIAHDIRDIMIHGYFMKDETEFFGNGPVEEKELDFKQAYRALCDVEELAELFTKEKLSTPVVAVIDRETRNMSGIIRRSRKYGEGLRLKGTVVTGAEIPEELLFGALDGARFLENGGLVSHNRKKSFTTQYLAPDVSGLLVYAPCDYKRRAAEKRQGIDTYNQDYLMRVLLERILFLRPKIVFLSNFKIILPPEFIEALENEGVRVINVHPSVLPLNRGWRTEKMAIEGKNPEASGYTIHAVTKDLDQGEVYFHQSVPVREYPADTKLEEEEEDMRARIIDAQAAWTPKVLELIASNIPRKTVEGLEAFQAEGKKNKYADYLETEYKEWSNTEENAGVSFLEWLREVHRPYKRVLFQTETGWQTAETILDAPKVADNSLELAPVTRFEFAIPNDKEGSAVVDEVAPRDSRVVIDRQIIHHKSDHRIECAVTSISAHVEERLKKAGISFQVVKSRPVRVNHPRQPYPAQIAA